MVQSRNSSQRTLIFNLMEGNKSHPTADDIYEAARKIDPHIGRGTVYRNLNLLAENGSILRIEVPDGADHFDSTLEDHVHFYCRKCNRVTDTKVLNIETILETQKQLEKMGYTSIKHTILFEGICPDCSKQ